MNKKLLEGLIAELRSDDDFAKLVFYFLGNGLRTMHQEIESGRDDDIAKVLSPGSKGLEYILKFIRKEIIE